MHGPRFSTIEISGELLDHLSACKRALEKVTHLLKTRTLARCTGATGIFFQALLLANTATTCGFDLPEFRTAEADDCNLYEQS